MAGLPLFAGESVTDFVVRPQKRTMFATNRIFLCGLVHLSSSSTAVATMDKKNRALRLKKRTDDDFNAKIQ
jgi:hypothetical protein